LLVLLLLTDFRFYKLLSLIPILIDINVLTELASGRVLALSEPPSIIKIVVPAFIEPEYGSYSIGDDVRLIDY
jgi:hypothetical protein